jgi:NADPH:quinone reductase-like Zn-dependent oxidoreductase
MKMHVVEIAKYGPPEVLQVKEREIPTPANGEVLIRVEASGVCRPDLVQ